MTNRITKLVIAGVFLLTPYLNFSQSSLLKAVRSDTSIKFQKIISTKKIPRKVFRKFKNYGYGIPVKMAEPNEPYQYTDYIDTSLPWTRLIFAGKTNSKMGFVYYEGKRDQPNGLMLYSQPPLKRMKYEVYSMPKKLNFDQVINRIKTKLNQDDLILEREIKQ